MKYFLIAFVIIAGLVVVSILVHFSLTSTGQPLIESQHFLPQGIDDQGRATSTVQN